jgi:hypothetical protein
MELPPLFGRSGWFEFRLHARVWLNVGSGYYVVVHAERVRDLSARNDGAFAIGGMGAVVAAVADGLLPSALCNPRAADCSRARWLPSLWLLHRACFPRILS